MWQDEAQRGFPACFRRIKERVATRDREWFSAHPGKSCYVRLYVPREFWPNQPPDGSDVVVLERLVVPGFRLREPFPHVVTRPGGRMHILDEEGRVLLRDVPMEGVGP